MRLLLLSFLLAGQAFGAADLINTQQGELAVASASREYAFTVGTDTADSGTTSSVIQAPGHAARVGDIVRFTGAGANYMVEARVQSTTADTITLYRSLPAVPAGSAAFDILRLTTPAVSANGSVVVSGGGGGGSSTVIVGGGTKEVLWYNDYTTSPVTAAYTEISASTPDVINQIIIFDSSGVLLALATGGAGSEVDFAFVPPGGTSAGIPIKVPAGSRLSIHAAGGVNAVSGSAALTAVK